jgi:isochorismate synthase
MNEDISRTSAFFAAFFAAALEARAPVALWRLPFAAEVAGVIAPDGAAELDIDFRRPAPGFVLAPFASPHPRRALHIPASLRLAGAGITVAPGQEHDTTLVRLAGRVGRAPDDARWYAPRAGDAQAHSATRAEFTGLVRAAVEFIRASGVAKVVVSRAVDAPLPPGFHPVAAFAALCERYPHAFVSLTSIPGVGTWLGASPETLLSLDGAAVTTMALAGTQPRPDSGPLEGVAWGQKETVEQEMVSAYIREFFAQAGVHGVQEDGPRTVAAGNVVHLQTLFRAALPRDARLALANRVLGELHPTSAVCGMPKHKALAFIRANEGYDRSFYSGFLGPVGLGERSDLFVNLRCTQLLEDRARLYVGAGVTDASDAEAEWRETELKAETILSVLAEPLLETA